MELKKLWPWLLGAGVVGGGVLLFRRAHAAGQPGLVPSPSLSPPAPTEPVSHPALPGTPSANLIPGQTATVVAPSGLNLRSDPTVDSTKLGKLAEGTGVLVLDSSRSDGWVKVQVPAGTGWVCNSCADAPGGPWLRSSSGTASTSSPTAETSELPPENGGGFFAPTEGLLATASAAAPGAAGPVSELLSLLGLSS